MQWLRHISIVLIDLQAIAVLAQPGALYQRYVFGDSCSDSGAGYVDGNGPMVVVYLAERLHIPFTLPVIRKQPKAVG